MLTNSFILVLASVGLIQGVFLSVYLLHLTKGNRQANLFLGLVILGVTIRIGKSVMDYYLPLEAWQRNLGISGILLAGPFLWFYGMTLIHKDQSFSKGKLAHLIPFGLFILLFMIIPSRGTWELYWNYGIVVIHLAIYLTLSWRLLYNNRLTVSKSIFYWYRNILWGITAVWCFYLGNFLSLDSYYITGPIFYSFLIYAFSFLLLNRHKFLVEKYNRSTLDRKKSQYLFQRIQTLFTNEQIYLTPEVSLQMVAEKLGVHTRMVSQAINENGQRNFSDFLNAYRIEEAKSLLANPSCQEKKIATIAYDSGFGNVTSFNIAFKKMTGKTPSAYRKAHLSS